MLQSDAIITLGAGDYRLRAPLAGSAYGLVWRAAAPGNGPDVALKLVNEAQMLRAPTPLRARWIDSMQREIAFLQSLAPWDERHIVRLLDSGTLQAHQRPGVGRCGNDNGAAHAFFTKNLLNKLFNFPTAFADQPNDDDIGFSVASHHAE